MNEDNLKGAKIFHEVQKLLIINDIPNVLNVVDEWSKSATANEQEILRFFAHMVIMLKRLDKTSAGPKGIFFQLCKDWSQCSKSPGVVYTAENPL